MINKTSLMTVVLSALLFSNSGFSEAPPKTTSIDEQIDAVFTTWDSTSTPGCAISVVQDGQTVFSKSYGMSNLETSTPISTDSIFHVASISKQFTAMALVLLEQDGKLSLDDNIRDYLPEVSDFGETITIRHLLHHTGGLRDQWDLLWLAGWREDDVKSEEDILGLVARQRSVNFSPGDEFLYCNTGFTLAGTIVERVSGLTLREFTEQRIFQPLGMHATHFHDDHRHLVRNRTSAYETGKAGELTVSIPVFDNAGATSLFTTVEDFVRWDQNFYDHEIGGEKGLAELLEPIVLNNGEVQPYALGIGLGNHRGLRTVGHGGADAGYRSNYLQFPDQRFSVIVFCNASRSNPGLLARSVADIFLADQLEPMPGDEPEDTTAPKSIELADEMLETFVGSYFNKKSATLRRILVKDGKLVYHRGEGNESLLAPITRNQFIMLGVGVKVLVWFEPVGTNQLAMYVSVSDGNAIIHDPVETTDFTPGQLTEFAGNYYSPEIDAEYQLYVDNGQLGLRIPRQESSMLTPLFTDAFSRDDGGFLSITRATGGRITGMALTTGRVRKLEFKRRY